MKILTDESLVARALAWLARAVCRYPRFFLYSQLVLFVLSVFFTVKFLQFDTNRSSLVGADKKYHRNFLQFKKEFPRQDDLVVVVQSENPEKNRQFVERLGAKLEAETNLFTDVLYKGDMRMLGNKALLFASATNVADLKQTLQDYRPFIQRFSGTSNLLSLFDMVNTEFRTASRRPEAETESMIKSIPALRRIVSQASASLRRPGIPPSPGITALFDPSGNAEKEIYITFANATIYLITAQPPMPRDGKSFEADSVARLRELVEETRAEVPGLNIGITGESVLEIDEMKQSQKDTTVASIASLIVCALIFIYGYKETGRPVKATLCLIVGLGYTMAFATLAIGHLNILTITFVPILIGLAIDFGVHLITRYEEELRNGKDNEAALIKAMVFTGQGIFTGAFTTAGAFLAMALTDFKGIQEMGIICGGGLLICLIPMLTLLPVLLLRGRQNSIDHDHPVELPDTRARIENIWLKRPITVSIITVALCAVAATQLPKIYFDYNLLHMQSAGLPAVEFEQKLIDSASKSVLYAAVVADSLDQAIKLEEQIKKLPVVAEKDGVDSIAHFLTSDQSQQLKLVGEIKQELAGIEFQEPDPRPVDVQEFGRTLYSLYGYLGAALQEVGTNEPALSGELSSLRRAIEDLRKGMFSGDPEQLETRARKLAAFQQALFQDVRETFQALKNQDNRAPLSIEDLPPVLRHRFVGVSGRFLLQVYPKKDVWVRANQEEFIKQLQKIDPEVTGTPVQLYYYTDLLKQSYVDAAWYALGAIVILVFIHFRSVSSVLLALFPIAIGALWLAGLMVLFDVPLNPANIMMLPLVIGIGVTNGIHILNRFAEEQNPSILAKSTGKAVFISGLTTIAGFGSLILAKHRGIHSLGVVMSVGVLTCMVAALTALPALLNLLMRRRSGSKQPSADNARSTLGREEPR
ncbi:MAG: MMPL family transporter [Verrucomicrobiota bacterium]